MPVTSEFALPYPAGGDPANVPVDMGELAVAVEAAINAAIPAGSIVATARATAPTGWLLCDGTAVSRTTFARLFAAIGTSYGAGNGTTTFNLPDGRGRVLTGVDGSAGRLSANDALGNSGGAETTTLTTGQIPAHSHGVSDPGHSHGITDPGHVHSLDGQTGGTGTRPLTSGATLDGASAQVDSATTGVTVNSGTTGITTQNAGGGAAHSNLQPFLVVNHIVRI